MGYESGEFGISISTESGLEGLKAKNAEGTNKEKILLVNLRTLVRNAYGVIGSDIIKVEDIVNLVLSDIELIKTYISNFTTPMTLEIYHCTYDKLTRQRVATIRTKFTEKQQDMVDLLDAATKSLALIANTLNGPSPNFKLTICDTRLTEWREPVVLLSHIPVDLLSYNEFPSMCLLESHTGVIKQRGEFHTKLKGTFTNPLPFNIFTLNIFGDKAMFFDGAPIKLRNLVNKLSTRHSWSPITSMRYMVDNIAKDSKLHPADKEIILKLSSIKY